MKLPEVKEVEPIEKRFHRVSSAAMDIMKVSLVCSRLDCHSLLMFNLIFCFKISIAWGQGKKQVC